MFGEMTGSWMFVALIETCVGSAMALYGWKQKESVSLAFGVILASFPVLVHDALLSALMGLLIVVLYYVVKKAVG